MKDIPEHGSSRIMKNPFRRLMKNTKPHSVNHTTLFTLEESEMSIYNNTIEINKSTSIHSIIKLHNSKSSLISKGNFEVYQINTSLNYFKCGSLIHPILQNCKFIQVNINTFIIPLKNPVRYWKLSLNTENSQLIDSFLSIIKSIAVLQIDLLQNYTLQSPFNSFNEETYQQPQLHHPIPIRPNSSSNTSHNSSIFLQYNNSPNTSLLEHYLTDNDKDLSSNIDSDLDNDLDDELDDNLDIDIDLDLDSDIDIYSIKATFNETNDLTLNNTANSIQKFQLLSDDDDDDSISELFQFNDNFLTNHNGNENTLTNRYSLSFKSYDLKRPLSINVLDKYKLDLTSMIQNHDS